MDNLWRVDPDTIGSGAENSTSSLLNSSRWLLAEDIHGPVVAVFVILEFILALVANTFIVVQTICHGAKILKQSSTLLLFLLAIINLFIVVFYMPFMIVASAAGEWIFGNSDSVRSALCQIQAFIFVFAITAFVHILAVISVDRCISITKLEFYRKYVTWKVTLVVVIFLMVIDLVFSLAPYYGEGVGNYDWSRRLGICFAIFVGDRAYILLQAIHALIPVSTIVITTIWTFVFTRRFFRKTLKRQQTMLSAECYQVQKDIYNVRVKNLIGIFGSLLIFNFISWMPYTIISLIGLVKGLDNVPNRVYSAAFVIFLFTNVSNPITQIYFRKDLVDVLKKIPFLRYVFQKISKDRITEIGSRITKTSKVQSYGLVVGHKYDDEDRNEAAANVGNNVSKGKKKVLASDSGFNDDNNDNNVDVHSD